MKTTIDLPAELVRAVKIRAAEENRRFKDVVAELLQRGLTGEARERQRSGRVQLPLLRGHAAAPGEELSAERVAQILADEDLRSVAG